MNYPILIKKTIHVRLLSVMVWARTGQITAGLLSFGIIGSAVKQSGKNGMLGPLTDPEICSGKVICCVVRKL